MNVVLLCYIVSKRLIRICLKKTIIVVIVLYYTQLTHMTVNNNFPNFYPNDYSTLVFWVTILYIDSVFMHYIMHILYTYIMYRVIE